jgi:hypothetical protein
MTKEIGRVTLFVNDKKGRTGAPDLNGKLVTEKGEYIIDLWKESANTKDGYLYKGRVTEKYKGE